MYIRCPMKTCPTKFLQVLYDTTQCFEALEHTFGILTKFKAPHKLHNWSKTHIEWRMRSPRDFFGGITFVVYFWQHTLGIVFLSRVNSAKFANFLENFTRFFWYLSQNCKKKNPGEEDSPLLEENLPIPSLNYSCKWDALNWSLKIGVFNKKNSNFLFQNSC